MNELNKAWWWGSDHDFIWNHIKLTMRNDWERTRHYLIPHQLSDQTITRVNAAPSRVPLFEEVETACRFGYGAHLEYDCDYPQWNADLEIELARDWESLHSSRFTTWEEARSGVRYGWNFEETDLIGEADKPADSRPKPVHKQPATEAMPRILEGVIGAKWIQPERKGHYPHIEVFAHIQSPSKKPELALF